MAAVLSVAHDRKPQAAIGTQAHPRCYLCGTDGRILYRDLPDRLFSAPGRWTLKRCPSETCGLIWLDPMPLESEIGKAYATYYMQPVGASAPTSLPARIYGAVRAGYLDHRYGYRTAEGRRWLWPLMHLHPGAKTETDAAVFYQRAPAPGTSLLDVGCGDGSMMAQMRDLGWTVEGIDVDPASVAAAKQRGLRVRQGRLETERFPAQSFDVVTHSHVLEHVHDPITLLRECHRVLKPGGRLVMFTPNADSWGHGRFGDAWLHLDPPRHLYLFQARTLRTTLERSGSWTIESLGSTIRGAGGNLTGSAEIRRSGRYRVASVFQMGPADLLRSQLWYFRYWLVNRRHPLAGEELALVASPR